MFQSAKNRLSLPLGWVVAVQVMVLVAAVYVHLFSALPLAYSWARTLDLFWASVTDEYFIVMACVALAAAAWVRKRRGSAPLALQLDRRFYLSLALVVAVLMAMVLSSSSYGLWDYVFLLPVVALAVPALRQRHPVKALAGFGATVAVLVVVSYAFTIFKSQLFVDRTPLDQLLVDSETWMFGRPLYLTIAEWASSHSEWVRFSDWVYYLFFHHMALTALFLFACDDIDEQWRYVLSLTLCYMLGGLTYFLLPAAGPIYFDPPAFSYLGADADFTVFVQRFLKVSTFQATSGQLGVVETFAFIACMPSLHMAHETIMLFYSRRSLLMLHFAAALWVSSFAAVLILGWHYLIDVVGGVLLAAIVLGLARRVRLEWKQVDSRSES